MAGSQVIGREGERAVIESWLDADRPSVLLIEGVAGIGKSTLWTYTMECAARRGDRVMSWRASQAERDFALAALTALFDVPEVSEILDRLPEPRRRALDVAVGRADPSGQPPQPSLVGLAVADVLRVLASAGPIVIGIDDLQWLDEATDEVLAFAARRLSAEPVGFVLARRTSGAGAAPAPAGLPEGSLTSSLAAAREHSKRMELGPLSVGALGTLIHERLGVAHPRPLLVRMHQACSGNSFLALEISRSLLARTVMLAAGEPFPVPPEAGPLVRDHLGLLSREARRCVVVVAMSPDPSLSMIERALGQAAGPAVDEACEKGVLVADGGRLRASHPLFTSTAYTDTPPGERRRLRRALANAVDDQVERAVHLSATVTGQDAAAAEALTRAGRLAVARGAPGVAAELLERAATVADGVDVQAALLIEAAAVAVAAGDPERAATGLRHVLDLVAHGRLRAEALLALAEIVYVEQPNDALPLLLDALSHTGGDLMIEAQVHSHIAGMADMDPVMAPLSALRAAEILEAAGSDADPNHVACALLDRAFHHLLMGEPAAERDIERGLRLFSGTGTSFVARRAQEVAERCLFHLGRFHEALALDEAEYRRLTETGQFGLLPPLVQSLSVLTQLTGAWGAARRYADECLELVEQGEQAWRERAMLARGRILAWEGDLDGARAIAAPALARQEAAGDRWEATIFCALLGFTELSAPDAPAALRYLVRALEHADAIKVVLPSQFRFLGDLVEAAVLAGDLVLAESVLSQRLEEPAVALPLPWTLAMARRGRGLLLAARGQLHDAASWFDQALDVYDTVLAMPFERARTCYARGQVHRRAGHWRAAREDLTAAQSVFDTLGAKAWLRRVVAELGRIGGRAPTASALTPSEQIVAQLAATGRSNKEIAAELLVSVRTVESQLSAVYRKLDIRARGQLAAALGELAAPAPPAPRTR